MSNQCHHQQGRQRNWSYEAYSNDHNWVLLLEESKFARNGDQEALINKKEENMSFVAAMIISNDCADSSLEQLREVYGISLEEVCNPSIRQQLDDEERVYMFSDDSAGYFWNNWTPIGAGKIFEHAKKVCQLRSMRMWRLNGK